MANARLAYEAYEKFFSGERWEALAAAGANRQRPLWASTGVKTPTTRTPCTSTTSSWRTPSTRCPRRPSTRSATTARSPATRSGRTTTTPSQVMKDLADAGIDYDDVIATLEKEGVEKFEKSWDELLATVTDNLKEPGSSDQLERGRSDGFELPSATPTSSGSRMRRRSSPTGWPPARRPDPTLWGRTPSPRRAAAWPGSTLPGVPGPGRRDRGAARRLAAAASPASCSCGMGGSSLAPEVICATARR